MCGVLGVVKFGQGRIDGSDVVRMRDVMTHRGPDGEGLFVSGPVALAHRRLAIIDLSGAGKQPMTNEDGSIVLVFNGEIYNYVELREALVRNGHQFSSASDTEVIIHQYEEDGEACVKRFNGMFSFLLWDDRKKRLFGARDRLGIKPLYYFADRDRVILASEIKAIIEDETVPREPNLQGIVDYFFAGRSLGTKTVFGGIEEVAPGHTITVDVNNRRVRVDKYWDVVYNYNFRRSDEQVDEELFALLDNAVKIHCRSDAALGCQLSGGLDSSTVVALSARHRQLLTTFSIKFTEPGFFDETQYAKRVAAHVGAQYMEDEPKPIEMAQLLPFLVWHMDVPMATGGGFAYYAASRLASRNVKVSLTGHGGDELFAGYPAQFEAAYGDTSMFVREQYSQSLHSQPIRKRLLSGLLNQLPRRLVRGLKNAGRSGIEDTWVGLHCSRVPYEEQIFQLDFVKSLGDYSPKEAYIRPFKEVMTDQLLDKCLYHDLRVYLPALLHLEDRASMACSIESRVPLLDYRLVEFLASVPPDQKVRYGEPKHLMRGVASKLLPPEIYSRKDKCGFPVPNRFFVFDKVKALIREILLAPECIQRGVISPDVLKAATDHFNPIVWKLVNLELWFKLFIDRNQKWIERARIGGEAG